MHVVRICIACALHPQMPSELKNLQDTLARGRLRQPDPHIHAAWEFVEPIVVYAQQLRNLLQHNFLLSRPDP